MAIKKFLKTLVDQEASDLFLRAGGIPRLRVNGKVIPLSEPELTVEDVMQMAEELTTIKQREIFKNHLDVDFAIFLEEFNRRFRVSVFMQRNWPSIVIRNVRSSTQTFEDLNLPAEVLKKLAMERSGLILLTGSMGSGKSTTIASMIEYINLNASKHILTLEEPIEFTFNDKKSIVNQRELGIDVSSYNAALRAFTLQSPDVIYIANIRDAETMSAAMTAAETGVLVLSTLHTVNAPKTVERIVNFFPPHEHQEIKNRLSSLLKGAISLRLIPRKDGSGRIPAYEVMLLTPTISRLIREGKIWEIPQYIDDGSIFGMQSFNQSLVKLVRDGMVTEEDAAGFADSKEEFDLVLKGIKKA
ncbi:MAG: PilT/PilU family type 4a pilus ATPase [Candidatus Omnitrophica bacterium]|nr:PilT/PilU family type 4a pilus ATPase [Candidatus Omnitrophota bacterium]